jgi:hypothetical protein
LQFLRLRLTMKVAEEAKTKLIKKR